MSISSASRVRPAPVPIVTAITQMPARPVIGPVVGIDVGEDLLDLAILDRDAQNLRLARVAVNGVERDGLAQDRVASESGAIAALRRRMLAAAPELDATGATVLIDSPRWPRDLDLARSADGAHASHRAEAAGASRAIDTALRAIVSELALQKRDGTRFHLALFPTPKLEFFAACARDPRCKPHLAAVARELFGRAIEGAPRIPAPAGGGVFTRFMLTGFAAYRALEHTRAACFEAYPDLAFRLWARGEELPPKGARRAALDARLQINRRLAAELGCTGVAKLFTLDEADAAVLALSAALASRAGTIAIIEHPGEGRFALALDERHARRAKIGYMAGAGLDEIFS